MSGTDEAGNLAVFFPDSGLQRPTSAPPQRKKISKYINYNANIRKKSPCPDFTTGIRQQRPASSKTGHYRRRRDNRPVRFSSSSNSKFKYSRSDHISSSKSPSSKHTTYGSFIQSKQSVRSTSSNRRNNSGPVRSTGSNRQNNSGPRQHDNNNEIYKKKKMKENDANTIPKNGNKSNNNKQMLTNTIAILTSPSSLITHLVDDDKNEDSVYSLSLSTTKTKCSASGNWSKLRINVKSVGKFKKLKRKNSTFKPLELTKQDELKSTSTRYEMHRLHHLHHERLDNVTFGIDTHVDKLALQWRNRKAKSRKKERAKGFDVPKTLKQNASYEQIRIWKNTLSSYIHRIETAKSYIDTRPSTAHSYQSRKQAKRYKQNLKKTSTSRYNIKHAKKLKRLEESWNNQRFYP